MTSLRGIDLAVFMALLAGCSRVREVCELTGYSAFRVRESLKQLLADGFVERANYRMWGLAEGGHEVINSMWIIYVKLFIEHPEAHKMIASTIAETHKMIASESGHNSEAHERIVSSAQNDRFSPPYMHVNDHACMDDAYSLRNKPVDSIQNPIEQLEYDLNEIGFDQPGRWLRKENVSWELAVQWLEYANSNGGIRNKAGFIRRQVEAGEKPNLVKAKRNQVPAEYEHLIRR